MAVPASEYGKVLLGNGFTEVNSLDIYGIPYYPLSGDVVVWESFTGHVFGHIEMHNGYQWVSNFYQKYFYPRVDYIKNKTNYVIYRWQR